MLNKTEQDITSLLLRAPYEAYTVYGIAKRLNRYVSQVQKAVKHLEKIKTVSVKKLGLKTSSCTLNFSKADADILAYTALYAKKLFLEKNLKVKVISNEIEKRFGGEMYIMLIFGSYAKGNAAKKSDMDLCFIIQDEVNIEKFKLKIKSILSRFSYKIHINVFTTEWFYNMLKEKDTVGREILKASVVLHGADIYYNLVKKYDQEAGYSESESAI